jgi:hypothetical protein
MAVVAIRGAKTTEMDRMIEQLEQEQEEEESHQLLYCFRTCLSLV